MPEELPVPADGRLARSQRTRRAIVDALRSLHADGDLRPTAPRVADRAGVSLRTVWQHFDDLESLFVEGGRRDVEIAQTFVRPVDPLLPVAERAAAIVEQRARMFESMAPTWRAARLQEPFSPQIQTNRDRLVAMGREQLQLVFAPELAGVMGGDRTRLLDTLHVTTSWTVWESLRTELKMSPAGAREVVVRLVHALLAIEEHEEKR
jgi:TetR/AcrR family transcriptional regulator of autoinduction and epiphytic fitness